MKQQITSEQLNELSDKGKYTLWIWERNKEYGDKDSFSKLSELSVGQMIEFLDEQMPVSYITHQSQWHGGNWHYDGGSIPSELTLPALEKSIKSFESNELCDALWEAVKDVLEEK
jgi:hypothetical protein